MTAIDTMIDGVFAREKGYVNHPSDRGGPTRYGITEAVARANGYTGDMRELPMAVARKIYVVRYWTGPGFDRVMPFSQAVAEELLDTGVNMGQAVAAGMLQRSLNALNRQGKDFADVVPDGRIGPATLSALGSYFRARRSRGEVVLMRALNGLQTARYIEIAEARPPNEDFVFGWLDQRVLM